MTSQIDLKAPTRRTAMALAAGALLSPARTFAAGDTVVVETDVSRAPQLGPYVEEATRRVKQDWWPVITSRLASPGFTPPSRVRLVVGDTGDPRAPASTSGATITISTTFDGDLGNIGMVAHELVHVVQQYPNPMPNWLTEGVADYMRYYVLLPDDPRRRFDPHQADFSRGYQPAAAMLDFAERRYLKPVEAVNTVMRGGGSGVQALIGITGQTPRDLWSAYLQSLTA